MPATDPQDLQDRLHCLEQIIDAINDGIIMSDPGGRSARQDEPSV